jgi:hypothetical protein
MPLSQSVQSLRNLYFKVEDRFGLLNPTGDVVQLAFVPPGTEPQGADWKAGNWFTDATNPARPVYYAVALVGPAGTFVLAKGTYVAWLKWTDNPEIPADPVAPITIT